jgi:hypothetical protein
VVESVNSQAAHHRQQLTLCKPHPGCTTATVAPSQQLISFAPGAVYSSSLHARLLSSVFSTSTDSRRLPVVALDSSLQTTQWWRNVQVTPQARGMVGTCQHSQQLAYSKWTHAGAGSGPDENCPRWGKCAIAKWSVQSRVLSG